MDIVTASYIRIRKIPPNPLPYEADLGHSIARLLILIDVNLGASAVEEFNMTHSFSLESGPGRKIILQK